METQELINLIIDYRARNNLSLEKMAEKCGICKTSLWLLETGKHKHKPNSVTVRKILNVLEDEVL